MGKVSFTNRTLLLVAATLTILTIVSYLQVLRADFVNLDDIRYVTKNLHMQSGLTMMEIPWAFNIGYMGNWHPVTWMSHMLDVTLFGMNPVSHHAVNLLLHLANTLLLLFVLNRMTKSLWKSAFVAALFAVHPMHVESVAWVAERKDVLSTLFWLLTMWAYVRYTESPNIKRYSAVVVFFALGLMSKPTLVTLPFILLLLDYWPLGRWANAPWRLIREKLPLFAMSAASCVVTYLAQENGAALDLINGPSLASRAANALSAYVSYIAKMFWPAKLAVFYPYPHSIPIWQTLTSVLILAAVTILVIRTARSRPYLVVGWLWYLIALMPMIGLVQVGRQGMADRYTYVPFIGLFIILTWGVSELLSRHVASLRVVSVLVIIVLAGCTWRQTGYWRDSITLWTHTLTVTTENDTAHSSLGIAYGELGRYPEAANSFEQTVLINPNYPNAYFNLGKSYGALGRYAEAVDAFKQATLIDPDYPDAHYLLGVTLSLMGNKAMAVEEYKVLADIDPEMANKLFGVINR